MPGFFSPAEPAGDFLSSGGLAGDKSLLPAGAAGLARRSVPLNAHGTADPSMFCLTWGARFGKILTLTLGEVTRNKRGEVCTQHLSYCSRLAEAERFVEAALVETHRRGLERATEVCASYTNMRSN